MERAVSRERVRSPGSGLELQWTLRGSRRSSAGSSPVSPDSSAPGGAPQSRAGGPRVALLMNFVAPYRVKLFQAVRRELDAFRIFVSTSMEPDRPWTPDWTDLDVVMQKTLTFPVRHRQNGFDQQLFIHFPYDTMARLYRYDPDVVVSGELGLRSLQAALYRRLRPRSRLIIWATLSEYSETGWGGVRAALRRFILRCADGVIVNGASGARYIQTINPSVRIFTMNQPVDLPRFLAVPLERPPEVARRLIFSGRLIGQKGVIEFQRAAAEWARTRPHLTLDFIWLGDGELRPALEFGAGSRQFRADIHGICRSRFAAHHLRLSRRARPAVAVRRVGACRQRSHGQRPPGAWEPIQPGCRGDGDRRTNRVVFRPTASRNRCGRTRQNIQRVGRGSHGDAPGSAGALSNDNLRGGGREHARSDSCCLMCRHADLIAFEHGSNTCLPPGRKISICAHHPL